MGSLVPTSLWTRIRMTLFFPDLNVWLAATRSRGARTHACPFLQPTQRNERWGGPPGPRGSPWTRYLKHRQIPASGRGGRRPRTRGSTPLCIRPSESVFDGANTARISACVTSGLCGIDNLAASSTGSVLWPFKVPVPLSQAFAKHPELYWSSGIYFWP